MATTFTNQAILSYSGNTVRSNVAVGAVEGALSIDKQSLSANYAAGDTMTYIISAVNSGTANAAGLTLTDDLGAYPFGAGTVQPMDYVTGSVQYYLDGVLQAAPAVDTTSGLAITGLSIPSGSSAVIIYSAQLNEFAPLAAGSTIINNVELSGTDICGVTASATVTAESGAVMSMMKFKSDHEAQEVAKREADLLEKFGNMTFEEMMKRERENEE